MAKVSKGRKKFSSAVGRPTINSRSFSKPASKTSHPYGDDWPQQSALCKKRDDYRCMAHKIGLPRCKNRFPPPLHHLLHAHHLVRWVKSKNNSLKNLITLCTTCHNKEHGRKVGYEATEAQVRFSRKL